MICESVDDCDFFNGCCGYAYDPIEVIERVCSGENSSEPEHMYELKDEGFKDAEFSCELPVITEDGVAGVEHAM